LWHEEGVQQAVEEAILAHPQIDVHVLVYSVGMLLTKPLCY
jgi:hypothetical protein